ncbi:hypothetical protein B0A48_08967 [Cryoendolithus antarcticus]|uniref:Extracellular membrane protein CFEM domain-containing protein n=1 Tax=Cryoendolithus antarcticus TaxID=1507870 RepID=A0A1V8T4M8_9PEZI|nr:hypothetical protein B0A48_08967 [Cryoendolithus antarcticus]
MSIARLLAHATLVNLATSQLVVPWCLQACLTNSHVELCSSPTPSELTACILKECPSPPATQNLIANLDVSYTPKVMYSCEQSFTPGDSDNSVTLPLNQSCATSPYGFKSFIPHASAAINAANGCRVLIYSEEECLGIEASSADLGIIDGGQCIFRGGRSARLTCSSELDAARAYIESTCGNSTPGAESAGQSTSTSEIVPDAKSTSSALDTTSSSARSKHTITLPSSVTTSSTSLVAGITHTITLSSTASSVKDVPISASSLTTHTITISSPLPTLTATSSGSEITTCYLTLPTISATTTSTTAEANISTLTDGILTINPYTTLSPGNTTVSAATTSAVLYPPSMTMQGRRPENITSFMTFTAAPTVTADLPAYTGAAARLATAAWSLGGLAIAVILVL